MDNCDWCNLSEEDKQFKVYESKSWSFSFQMNRIILDAVYWF